MSDKHPDAEQVGKIIKLLETGMDFAEDLMEGTLV